MHILSAIYIITIILIAVYALYFGALTASGLSKDYKTFEDTDILNHFAILIAARNEEKIISPLLESIRDLNYPKDHVDTFVIINNCTDRTEEVSREHGAEIIRCEQETRNKADALSVAFDTLAERNDIDAYVILDADNEVDPSYLLEMNKVLASGAKAAQGKRRGTNVSRNWLTGCYEIFYAIQNSFFNHPQTVEGRSGSLNGSGWILSKELIDRYGFDTSTIIEDHEYALQTVIRGDKIEYCDAALVYDNYVEELRRSMTQRTRWSFGMIQCMRKYLFRTFAAHSCLSLAMVNLLPIFILLIVVFALLSIPMLPHIFGSPGAGLLAAIVILVIIWISISISALMAITKSHIPVRSCIKGILLIPIFMATWVPIVIPCLFRRDMDWKEIRG